MSLRISLAAGASALLLIIGWTGIAMADGDTVPPASEEQQPPVDAEPPTDVTEEEANEDTTGEAEAPKSPEE